MVYGWYYYLQPHLHRRHLAMRHRSAHVFTLRETHVRDAVGFHLLLLLLSTSVLSPAAASLVAPSSITTAAAVLSVMLGTAEKRGPKVVDTSTEQIYIMDTVEVDRLWERKHRQRSGNRENRKYSSSKRCVLVGVD